MNHRDTETQRTPQRNLFDCGETWIGGRLSSQRQVNKCLCVRLCASVQPRRPLHNRPNLEREGVNPSPTEISVGAGFIPARLIGFR